ncbi:MAG: hypothetical protein R3E32_22550 [Chitinophagales bacterium]
MLISRTIKTNLLPLLEYVAFLANFWGKLDEVEVVKDKLFFAACFNNSIVFQEIMSYLGNWLKKNKKRIEIEIQFWTAMVQDGD